MKRTVYVNGAYVCESEASISIFDRGFLMADGVYEVTSVLEGKMLDFEAHMARLERSLNELNMPSPASVEEIKDIHRRLIKDNSVKEGGVYLQITRGPDDRNFTYPKDPQPSLVLFTQEKSLLDTPQVKNGMKIISVPDIRWGRRDIKTIQLLAPSMGKMAAIEAGADDAWFVEDGFVTEGTSNNAYIIKDGVIITRNLSNDILHGITRAAVLRLAEEAQMSVEERAFTIEEAVNADEAFVTSASTFVCPVVEIDGQKVGSGIPSSIVNRLREIYIEESLRTAI